MRTIAGVLGVAVALCVATVALYPRGGAGTGTLRARDFVLISRFQNATGDSTFDGGIENVLARELAGSTSIEIVSGERLVDALRLMKRPLNTTVDRAVAREISVRDGHVKAMITGEVAHSETGYVVKTQLVDPANDAIIAEVADRAERPAGVLAAVAKAADTLDRVFVLRRSSIKGTLPVEQVSTASFRAFQEYNEAVRRFSAGHAEDAITINDRAIADDPQFAMAWRFRSYLFQRVRPPGEVCRAAAERAVLLAESAPEWERHFIVGWQLWLSGDYASAAPEFEAAVALRPQFDPGARQLIDSYLMLEQPGRAVAAFKSVADQRPLDIAANLQAASTIVSFTDNLEAAAPYVVHLNQLLTPERANAPRFSSAELWRHFLPVYEAWRAGDMAGALRTLQHLASSGDDWKSRLSPSSTHAVIGAFYVALGRLHNAQREMRQSSDSIALGLVLSEARGDRASLGRYLARMSDPAGVQQFVETGLIDEARARLASHRRGVDEIIQNLGRAALALHDGNLDEGLELLRDTLHRPVTRLFSADYQGGCALLANTLIRLGRTQEAINELETCTAAQPRYFGMTLSTRWLDNQLTLADAYRTLDRRADAERVETSVRRFLAVSDADNPLVMRLNAR